MDRTTDHTTIATDLVDAIAGQQAEVTAIQEAGRALSAANRARLTEIRDGLQSLAYHPDAARVIEQIESPLAGAEPMAEATDPAPAADATAETRESTETTTAEQAVGSPATPPLASGSTPPSQLVEAPTELSWEEIERRVGRAVQELPGHTDRYLTPDGREHEMPCAYVRATYADRVVYQFKDTTFERSYRLTDDGAVELGEPVEVAQTFMPLTGERMAESFAGRIIEAKGKDGKEWDVLLIQTGLSKNGTYYPAETLKAAVPLFEGASAFADHATEAERRARPERSIKDKVGTFKAVEYGQFSIGGTLVEGLKARFKVIPQWLREMLREAVAMGEADFLGFSIDAEGTITSKRQDGKVVKWVEAITRVHSVDVVTDPAAGGRVMRLVASNRPVEVEAMTAEELAALIAQNNQSLFEQVNAQIAERFAALASAEAAKTETPATPVQESAKPETPDPLAAVAEAAQAALTEAKALREEARKEKGKARLAEALTSAQCSDLSKERIRKEVLELVERRDFEDTELAARIQEATDYEAALAGILVSPASRHRVAVGDSSHDQMEKALKGWFRQTPIDGVKPFRNLREAYGRWNSQEYLDVDPLAMYYGFGVAYDSGLHHDRIRESLATSSWGEIFADNLYVMMIEDYREPSQFDDWRKLVSDVENVPDFQTRHFARIGGYADLDTVDEQGTYPQLTSPGDEEVAYSISKRGGLDDVTLEMLSYERGAQKLRKIPGRLSRAAKRTLWKFVLNLFTTDNPTLDYDSVALYHASHGNTGITALSLNGFDVTQRAMRDQTPFGTSDEPLGSRNLIKYLIVPNELEMRAHRIVSPSDSYVIMATDVDTGTEIDPQAFKNKGVEVIVYDILTDASDWFAVANPKEVPTAVVGFWRGQQEPELFVADTPNVGSTFSADKVTWKVRHVYGGDVLDHRSCYRQAVS